MTRGFLTGLGVLPAMRSRGIGRTLLLAATRWLCEERVAEAELTVDDFNAGATRLYERLGFVPVSIEATYSMELAQYDHGGSHRARASGQLGEMLGHGREADIVAWGAGRLLKLYLSPDRRDDAEHEARITAAVRAAGCPAPQCFGLAEVNGRTGLILEWLSGPMLIDRLLAGPDPAAALRQLADLQAEIHRHHIPGLSALHNRLTRRINSIRPVTGGLADAALNQLDRLPQDRALCHWDLHPGNVIVTERGPVVIDWSGAASGNQLADVARSFFLLADAPLMNDAPPELVNSVARARAAGVDAYLDRYCAITGAARSDIAAWRLPVLIDRLADGIPEERDLILHLARAACDSGPLG